MKQIILTGANGFLGQYIKNELAASYQVTTVSRSNAMINVDLSIETPKLPAVEMVVHCAGKAHAVPKTAKEKADFFKVNVQGTKNLLKGLALSPSLPHAFVYISSVAVYGCEAGVLINENQALNATNPYGQSKIEAEQIVQAWCAQNKVICSILRLPLLVGANPPGNLAAMIKGIQNGYYFNIAGGVAKKSMVLAVDVAKFIPIVANVGGVYHLTDGYHPNFLELSTMIAKQMQKDKPLNMPLWLAKLMANFGDILGSSAPINSKKLSKITSELTFDDQKARTALKWKPMPVLDSFN